MAGSTNIHYEYLVVDNGHVVEIIYRMPGDYGNANAILLDYTDTAGNNIYDQDHVRYHNYQAAINASKSSADVYDEYTQKWNIINTPTFSMKFQLPFQCASNVLGYKGLDGQLVVPHLIEDGQGGQHLALWMHLDFIEVGHKMKKSKILHLGINSIMSKDAPQ